MKAQCEKCKEIVALEFDLAEGGIRVYCGACGQSFAVAARAHGEGAGRATPAASAPRAEPRSAPRSDDDGVSCPKCGVTQPRGEACRACGLVFAKWRGPEALADTPLPELGDARVASALWTACQEAWDDAQRHDAFVDHCQRTQSFALAAQRYRTRLARAPGDVVAEERLQQIRQAAEASLVVVRPKKAAAREETRDKKPILVVLFVMAIALGGVVYLLATQLGPSPTP
jgi:hypothetical protein